MHLLACKMLFIIYHSFLCKYIYCTSDVFAMEAAGLAVSRAEITWQAYLTKSLFLVADGGAIIRHN